MLRPIVRVIMHVRFPRLLEVYKLLLIAALPGVPKQEDLIFMLLTVSYLLIKLMVGALVMAVEYYEQQMVLTGAI